MACGTSDTHGIPANDPRTRQSGRCVGSRRDPGVLGHDAMVHCADGGVEDEYAELLQEQCRRAGIMHLMAVSGGHYALVGTLVMGLGHGSIGTVL